MEKKSVNRSQGRPYAPPLKTPYEFSLEFCFRFLDFHFELEGRCPEAEAGGAR